jgi:hypothetical protein
MGAQRAQDHAHRKRHQQPPDGGRVPSLVCFYRQNGDLHQHGAQLAERGGEAVEGTTELCREDFGWDLGRCQVCFF